MFPALIQAHSTRLNNTYLCTTTHATNQINAADSNKRSTFLCYWQHTATPPALRMPPFTIPAKILVHDLYSKKLYAVREDMRHRGVVTFARSIKCAPGDSVMMDVLPPLYHHTMLIPMSVRLQPILPDIQEMSSSSTGTRCSRPSRLHTMLPLGY